MEKVEKYKKYILQLLKSEVDYSYSNESEVEMKLISDEKGSHFQLMSIGWNGGEHIYNCYVHFDIIDGKIWLQRNMTERNFAEELVALGVPKSDIVIGFWKPSLRKYSDYAVA